MENYQRLLQIEYAAYHRMHDQLASLLDGQDVSECPQIPMLCATLSSIIDTRDTKNFDRAVDILWELHEIVLDMVPFESFGLLLIDILIFKLLVEMIECDSDNHEQLVKDILGLFRIPSHIKLNHENEKWLDKKYKNISKKLIVIIHKEGGRDLILSNFNNMITCNCFWDNIKERVNAYLDKANEKFGIPILEVFLHREKQRGKDKSQKEQVDTEQDSSSTKRITDPFESRKTLASTVKSHCVKNTAATCAKGPTTDTGVSSVQHFDQPESDEEHQSDHSARTKRPCAYSDTENKNQENESSFQNAAGAFNGASCKNIKKQRRGKFRIKDYDEKSDDESDCSSTPSESFNIVKQTNSIKETVDFNHGKNDTYSAKDQTDNFSCDSLMLFDSTDNGEDDSSTTNEQSDSNPSTASHEDSASSSSNDVNASVLRSGPKLDSNDPGCKPLKGISSTHLDKAQNKLIGVVNARRKVDNKNTHSIQRSNDDSIPNQNRNTSLHIGVTSPLQKLENFPDSDDQSSNELQTPQKDAPSSKDINYARRGNNKQKKIIATVNPLAHTTDVRVLGNDSIHSSLGDKQLNSQTSLCDQNGKSNQSGNNVCVNPGNLPRSVANSEAEKPSSSDKNEPGRRCDDSFNNNHEIDKDASVALYNPAVIQVCSTNQSPHESAENEEFTDKTAAGHISHDHSYSGSTSSGSEEDSKKQKTSVGGQYASARIARNQDHERSMVNISNDHCYLANDENNLDFNSKRSSTAKQKTSLDISGQTGLTEQRSECELDNCSSSSSEKNRWPSTDRSSHSSESSKNSQVVDKTNTSEPIRDFVVFIKKENVTEPTQVIGESTSFNDQAGNSLVLKRDEEIDQTQCTCLSTSNEYPIKSEDLNETSEHLPESRRKKSYKRKSNDFQSPDLFAPSGLLPDMTGSYGDKRQRIKLNSGQDINFLPGSSSEDSMPEVQNPGGACSAETSSFDANENSELSDSGESEISEKSKYDSDTTYKPSNFEDSEVSETSDYQPSETSEISDSDESEISEKLDLDEIYQPSDSEESEISESDSGENSDISNFWDNETELSMFNSDETYQPSNFEESESLPDFDSNKPRKWRTTSGRSKLRRIHLGPERKTRKMKGMLDAVVKLVKVKPFSTRMFSPFT